jgi:hypothetical protein
MSSWMTTGGAPELSLAKSVYTCDAVLHTSTWGTVPMMGQCNAPAPGAQSPWDSVLGAIEDSISQCTFLQMTYTDEIPHTDGSPLSCAHDSVSPAVATPTTRVPHP